MGVVKLSTAGISNYAKYSNTLAGNPAFDPTLQSWTSYTKLSGNTSGAAFGNNTWVLSGGNTTVQTSSNLSSWTSRTVASYYFGQVAFGNGTFVLTVYSNTVFNLTPNFVYTSTDGITWTQTTVASTQGNLAIIYANGYFVMPSYTSNINTGTWGTSIQYSTNGTSWTSQGTQGVYAEIAHNGSAFCTPSQNTSYNLVYYSTNGTSWSSASPPSSAGWNRIAGGNNIFVMAVSGSTTGATSTNNGATWTSRTLPANVTTLTYASGKFALFTNNSATYYTSTDGVTWTSATLPTSGTLDSARLVNSKVLLPQGTTTLLVSP
jgi:hypothetical protein